jgi:hypothetical protein
MPEEDGGQQNHRNYCISYDVDLAITNAVIVYYQASGSQYIFIFRHQAGVCGAAEPSGDGEVAIDAQVGSAAEEGGMRREERGRRGEEGELGERVRQPAIENNAIHQ